MRKIKTMERTTQTLDRVSELLKNERDGLNKLKNLISDSYDCPLCNNRGWTAEIMNNAVICVECSCVPIRRNIKRVENSGLANVIDKYTLENYKVSSDWQEHIKRTAYEFLEIRKGWFFIAGQSGAGKTHICTGIFNELIQKGYNSKYMLWLDDSYKLKKNDEDADRLREFLKNVQVLYIDDFFKTEKNDIPSQADVKLAIEILNFRYINNKITLISSEKNISEIFDIDVAIAGRITEMSKGFLINIKNGKEKNYRLKM